MLTRDPSAAARTTSTAKVTSGTFKTTVSASADGTSADSVCRDLDRPYKVLLKFPGTVRAKGNRMHGRVIFVATAIALLLTVLVAMLVIGTLAR